MAKWLNGYFKQKTIKPFGNLPIKPFYNAAAIADERIPKCDSL